MEAWREELYHSGILGMKWGVQNGPPYPLSRKAHSAAEKAAGWWKSLKKEKTAEEKEQERKEAAKKKRQKAAAKARKAKIKKAEAEKKEAKKQEHTEKKQAKRQEKFEKKRSELMKDPAWIKKHITELSDDELRAVKDRYNLEGEARDAVIRKMNTGKAYADMVLGYAETGINGYNTFAKVRNAFASADDQYPIIGEKKTNNNNKSNNNNNKNNNKRRRRR